MICSSLLVLCFFVVGIDFSTVSLLFWKQLYSGISSGVSLFLSPDKEDLVNIVSATVHKN